MSVDSESIAGREKQRAAWSSVVSAAFLAVLKLIVGLLTGSLGILSEAAHSGLDLVAALVTLYTVRHSDQPPDTEHHTPQHKQQNPHHRIEAYSPSADTEEFL